MAATGLVLFGFVVGAHDRQPAGLPRARGAQRLRRVPAALPARPGPLDRARRAAAVGGAPRLGRRGADARELGRAPASATASGRRASRRYASRTMVWSGPLLLAFIVYHLAHFTLGTAHPDFVRGRRLPQRGGGLPEPVRLGLLHRGDAGARPAPVPRRLEHAADARPQPPALRTACAAASAAAARARSSSPATSRSRSPCSSGRVHLGGNHHGARRQRPRRPDRREVGRSTAST